MHLLFQNFMLQKWYKSRERESLLSPIFKKTFTISWGPDLAYKFRAGDTSLQWNHIVNQPCIRHRDIDATGDTKHLSFFNMFVADSIWGFSRKKVIQDFFEFFTVCLELNPKKIYASYFSWWNIHGTYFPPDIEMREIRISLGISESKIIAFGDTYGMEAFVANTVEPVWWPRGELFYNLRESYNENVDFEDFMKYEKNWDIVEFFTHVLYNIEVIYTEKEEKYNFVEMTNKSAVAAWFWPQRISRIQENVHHIWDISILKWLKSFIWYSPIK